MITMGMGNLGISFVETMMITKLVIPSAKDTQLISCAVSRM